MAEAAQIPAASARTVKAMIGPMPGNRPQTLIVGSIIGQHGVGLVLDRISLTDQASPLRDDQAEHDDCWAIHRHGQANG